MSRYYKVGIPLVEMFSDVSDLQVGGARFNGEKVAWDTVFKAALAEEERKKSSTFRELRGIEEGILANGRRLQGKVVIWGCGIKLTWCLQEAWVPHSLWVNNFKPQRVAVWVCHCGHVFGWVRVGLSCFLQ